MTLEPLRTRTSSPREPSCRPPSRANHLEILPLLPRCFINSRLHKTPVRGVRTIARNVENKVAVYQIEPAVDERERERESRATERLMRESARVVRNNRNNTGRDARWRPFVRWGGGAPLRRSLGVPAPPEPASDAASVGYRDLDRLAFSGLETVPKKIYVGVSQGLLEPKLY